MQVAYLILTLHSRFRPETTSIPSVAVKLAPLPWDSIIKKADRVVSRGPSGWTCLPWRIRVLNACNRSAFSWPFGPIRTAQSR